MRCSALQLWPLLAVLALASACAPTYQLGLKPAHPTSRFVEGREQAQAQLDSVEVGLSFVCYEPTRVVFEAEYRNPTHHALVVDPAAFRYEPSRLPAPILPAGQKVRRPNPLPGTEVTAATAAASQRLLLPALPAQAVAAYDPEPEITRLRATADQEAAKAARFDWLGLALTITSVALDISSVGERQTVSQYQSRAAIQDMAFAYNVASAANKAEHAISADVLQQRAAHLQEYALRKVTLEPGQQVRGYLYFPRYDAADGLVLQAPVGSRVVPLEFSQLRRRR